MSQQKSLKNVCGLWLTYSPRVCVGFCWVLQLPPTVQEQDPEEHRIHTVMTAKFYFVSIT